MAERGSPWTKGPSRKCLAPPPEYEGEETSLRKVTFQPNLTSNPALREKAQSSGYGINKVEVKKKIAKLSLKEQQDLAEATFKPNLDATKSIRKRAQSAGYGKEIPKAKDPPRQESPSFKPKTHLSREGKKLAKAAKSSGYGKEIASPKESPKPEKYPFKPNLDVSNSSRRMRKAAPAKSYLEIKRPQSAPPKVTETVQRHTLAADRAPGPAHIADVRTTLDTTIRPESATYIGTFPQPKPTPQTSVQKKLRESAASSGYTSSSYEPPRVEVEEKQPEEKLRFGTATTYKDSPDKLEKFTPTGVGKVLASKVTTSGYGSANYTPPTGERKEAEEGPLWRPTSAKASTAPVTELPDTPKSQQYHRMQSTGYGSTWEPPVYKKLDVEYLDSPNPTRRKNNKSNKSFEDTQSLGVRQEPAENADDNEEETTVLPLHEDQAPEDATEGEDDVGEF
eukprot:m.110167 g.110167  ORF g.110167 m.110167 type:complete len:451 (-) comp14024_c0_seq4:123-1475(-)